jgi:hypothetical protein
MYLALQVAMNAEDTPEFKDVLAIGRKLGLKLERTRSAPNDVRPRPWYSAAVIDVQAAKEFIAAVARSPAVVAAYLKPADAQP